MAHNLSTAVYGFMRSNFKKVCPTDIIDIICEFYRSSIASKILQGDDDISLSNLIFDTLKKQKGNEDIKSMDTQLLFRASDHGYSSDKFHEYCDEKGSTITIIVNEYNHVFGGYAKESWQKPERQITDANAFLFMIRPKIKTFHLKDAQKNGYRALWMYPSFGPVFGKGADIWIKDKCNASSANGCLSNFHSSFEFDAKEISGCTSPPESDGRLRFKITDYEVFSVILS